MALQVLKITGVITTYVFFSISMIFANKYLVGDRNSAEDITIMVAWIQCAVTVIWILCMRKVQKQEHSSFQELLQSLKKIFPLTITFVFMLTFNNLCLKFVGVAFFQIARSMTLIFTVILSVLTLKKKISGAIFLSCFCVAGGFVLGIDQENLKGTLSIKGVVFGIITSFFVATNGVFIKKFLDVMDKDSVKLTFYNNINAVLLFLPIVLVTGQFTTFIGTKQSTDVYFWLFLCVTGVMAFSMAWISAVQINLTSPVTHHIIANVKAVIQTLIAVIYYQEHKPFLWWVSILMVVGGATAYALVRIREEQLETVAEKEQPNDVSKV